MSSSTWQPLSDLTTRLAPLSLSTSVAPKRSLTWPRRPRDWYPLCTAHRATFTATFKMRLSGREPGFLTLSIRYSRGQSSIFSLFVRQLYNMKKSLLYQGRNLPTRDLFREGGLEHVRRHINGSDYGEIFYGIIYTY